MDYLSQLAKHDKKEPESPHEPRLPQAKKNVCIGKQNQKPVFFMLFGKKTLLLFINCCAKLM